MNINIPTTLRLVTIFAICTLSIPLRAQVEIENASDPHVHSQTGMQFPITVGNFQRHQVIQYSDDGTDMGFGYQLIRGGKKIGYISIFIYPAPETKAEAKMDIAHDTACKSVFSGINGSITSRTGGDLSKRVKLYRHLKSLLTKVITQHSKAAKQILGASMA